MNKFKEIFYYHQIFKKKNLIDLGKCIDDYIKDVEELRTIWNVFYKIDKMEIKRMPHLRDVAIDSMRSTSEKLKIANSFGYYLICKKDTTFEETAKILAIRDNIFRDNSEIDIRIFAEVSALEISNLYEIYSHDAVKLLLDQIYNKRINIVSFYRNHIINCGKFRIYVANLINFFKPYKYE